MFGYTSSQCQVTPFNLGAVPVICGYGYTGQIYSAGVIPESSSEKTLCNADASITSVCPLQANLNSTIFTKLGGSSSFSFVSSDILNLASVANVTDCTSSKAKIFVSYSCIQTEETQKTKYNQASIISGLAILLVLVYMTVLHQFKRASDLNQKEWDIQTITPGDYTMQYEISSKSYEFFMTNIYPRDQARKTDISIGESLKSYIKRELERILTEKLHEVKKQPGSADISFAFNNAALIQLLRVRGQHIMYQRYDKMREVEG